MMPTKNPAEFLSRFGLTSFRPGQREVIAAIFAGADILCIMPTGGGKSLCYQLPSIAREGVTLVVSPLIALMKDQVDGLKRQGIRADFINSSLPFSEQFARMARLAGGQYDLVYVAPERFRNPRFIEALRGTKLQLLAVDEAHCISAWGHDFRHDYSRLGEFRRQLGSPQTIALTATATADVRDDVVRQLGLESPRTFVAGFARPNLHYGARTYHSKREKRDALLDFIAEASSPGIIYAATRKGCEELAEQIVSEQGRAVAVYHGGMLSDDRRRVQDDFMQGDVEIVAATNAFGMGIDKANVRFVVHYNVPGSVEAYYQEAGRAGRDGRPSECRLLYCPSDRSIQEFFINSAFPPRDVIAQVYAFLCSQRNDPIELTQQELKQALRLSIGTEGVGTCERLLAACGVLERMEPNRNMAAVRIESDLPTLVDLVPAPAHTRRRVIRAVESLVGQRRYELVYFRLHDVAETAELPLASVSRALRELTHLDVFDYVPPFRGRAIHMLRRDVPFERLEIDYQELEERRGSSLGKLDRMIRFVQTSRCRQLEILHYFGEATNEVCGNCDNCGAGRGAHSAVSVTPGALDNGLDYGLVEITRMVLSGVARGRGKFGKQVLTAMLCGSRSAKIAKWKLDQLSTFGLLSEFTQSEVSMLIEALVQAACLEQSDIDRFRPVISVTNLGLEVMRGRAPAPSSLAIPPKLEAKVRRFGARWQARMRRQSLAVGSRSPSSDPAGEDPRSTGFDGGMRRQAKPSHFWTWLLLRDGYTPDQCAGIRQIELPQLLRHLIEAVEDGLSVELGWVLSEDQIRELEKTVGQCFSPTSPSADLGGGLVAEHVQLFLKCRDRSRRTASPA